MSSVGRELSKRLIDVAGDARRYAESVAEFVAAPPAAEERVDPRLLSMSLVSEAERMESLCTTILRFEGEHPRELMRGAS